MSAECSKCGLDLVYPDGSWPVGECPACDHRTEVTEAMVERAAKALNDWWRERQPEVDPEPDDHDRSMARAALIAALEPTDPSPKE